MGLEKKYCFGEADAFPEDQFFVDEEGKLIHRVGNKTNWHYALTGILVNPPVSHNVHDLPIMANKGKSQLD